MAGIIKLRLRYIIKQDRALSGRAVPAGRWGVLAELRQRETIKAGRAALTDTAGHLQRGYGVERRMY